MSISQHFLRFALEHNALKFGEFTLKSGRISPYFFNAGVFNDGEAIQQLARFYAQTIVESGIDFDVLFGPAYKGIPLAAVTAACLAEEHNMNRGFAFNRKEAKDHGEGGNIIGAPLSGRVLIIDDVITAGTAIREALDIIAQHNATAAGIIICLDREERGQHTQSAVQEVATQHQIPVLKVASLTDLVEMVGQSPELSTHRESIQIYRQQYGV
jgi:orotate phosphoribosyltransferase